MHAPILRTLPVLIALGVGSGWSAAQAADTGGGSSAPTATSHHQLSHGDRKFVEDAARGGLFEVQSGQLAASKANDEQVKQFADRLVQDHGKANDELKQIAEAKGVKLPGQDKRADRHELDKLRKLSGDQFDREFARHEVKDHEKDIADFEQAASKLKDPDLKAWAEKQLPVLREHLALAQKLSGSGGAKSASNSSDTHMAGNKGSKH